MTDQDDDRMTDPIRVLLVSTIDDADSHALAQGLATQDGLAVDVAADGVESLVEIDGQPVDCVVIDDPRTDLNESALRERISESVDAPVYIVLADPATGASERERLDDPQVVTFPTPSSDDLSGLGQFIRTMVTHREKTRAVEQRHRLQRFIADLTDEVRNAPTQEDVVDIVCERLATSDYFDAAWSCDRPPETEPRTASGFEREQIEQLHAALEEHEESAPWVRAATDRESVVRSISGIDVGGRLGRLDLEIASVPLLHREIIYGVVTVVRNPSGERLDVPALIDPLTRLGQAAGHAFATTEIQAQSEIFQGAIEQAEPAIAILNEDGTVEYVNSAFESVYGYAKSEAIGSSLELLLPEDVDPTSLLTEVRDGTPWREEISQRRKGGKRFYADLSIAPVPVEGGTRWRYIAVASDITSLKQREQRLQVLSRVLRHNLRNGLGAVRGYIEAAADRADEEVASLLSSALASTDDLVATANTAREIQSALEKASLREHDLAAESEQVVARAREAFPDVTVSMSIPESVRVTATDSLEDALWELLENACEHGDGPVRLSVAVDDDRAVVEISDTGPGIPEYELSVIERSEETALKHGSGLGLWFAYWVVEGSGGELRFETDDGTTASVILPIADD